MKDAAVNAGARRYLDNGYNIYFRGGYAFNSHFEADLEDGYNGFGLTSALIKASGAPGGNALFGPSPWTRCCT